MNEQQYSSIAMYIYIYIYIYNHIIFLHFKWVENPQDIFSPMIFPGLKDDLLRPPLQAKACRQFCSGKVLEDWRKIGQTIRM